MVDLTDNNDWLECENTVDESFLTKLQVWHITAPRPEQNEEDSSVVEILKQPHLSRTHTQNIASLIARRSIFKTAFFFKVTCHN